MLLLSKDLAWSPSNWHMGVDLCSIINLLEHEGIDTLLGASYRVHKNG